MEKWGSSHGSLRLYLAFLLALVLSAPQLGRAENEPKELRVCTSGSCPYDQVADAVADALANDEVVIEGTLEFQQSANVTVPLTIRGQDAEVFWTGSDDGSSWLYVHSLVQLSGNISITTTSALLTLTSSQLTINTAGDGVHVDISGRFEQRGNVAVRTGGIGVKVAGVWEQNGTVTSYTQAVSVINGGVWAQNGPIVVNSITGVVCIEVVDSTWRQNGLVNVTSLAADGLAVESSSRIAEWFQRAPVAIRTISVGANPNAGIRFTGSAAFWWQYDSVTIAVEKGGESSSLPTPLVCDGGSWVVFRGAVFITPSEADVPGMCVPTQSVTNSSTPPSDAPSEQPILRFNATANSLRIVPKADKAVVEEAAVDLALASVVEVADNGTHLRTGSLRFGVWSVLELNKTDLAASQAFTYSSPISFSDDIGTQGRVELQVFLFDVATNVTIGDMAAFTVLPSFTKISLAISSWPWVSSNASRLEVRLGVSPPFSGVVLPSPSASPSPAAITGLTRRSTRQGSADDSGNGTATLTLTGQASSDGKRSLSTVVRFVSVVELDGELVQPSAGVEDLPVKFGADVERSAIVLSFRHFSSSLSYDPDLSVLVGGGRRGDGSSDDSAWIIGVSVAVPVAVAGVVVMVVVILAATTVAKKRRMRELQTRLTNARQDNDL